jgi:alanine dehydrogenase
VQVDPHDYLNRDFDVPVFCQLRPEHYVTHRKGLQFSFSHFTKFPQEYESTFLPYTKVTDILITGHYWDPRSPVFFTREEMKKPDFRISVIADISCDMNGPIPSTLRATTISDPFYAYNPFLEIEETAFSRQTNITVMSIDNLPGELPRDASHDFGRQLMSNVLHDLLSEIDSPMLERATIIRDGRLTNEYNYLNEYLNG